MASIEDDVLWIADGFLRDRANFLPIGAFSVMAPLKAMIVFQALGLQIVVEGASSGSVQLNALPSVKLSHIRTRKLLVGDQTLVEQGVERGDVLVKVGDQEAEIIHALITQQNFPENLPSGLPFYGKPLSYYEILKLQNRQVTDGKTTINNYGSGEFFMEGNKINVSGGQVGAIGNNAGVYDSTFNYGSAQDAQPLDLKELAAQLELVVAAATSKAAEPDHQLEIGAVNAAKAAAERGDKPGALKYLKSVGGWTLNIATEIGTKVAAEVISRHMGR